MEYVYLIGLIIIILSAWGGYKRGLINTLGRICASILSIGFLYMIKMWAFGSFLDTLLSDHNDLAQRVIFCLIVYLILYFILKAIVKSLHLLTSIPILHGLDKLLGLILGGAYGVLLVGIFMWIRSWFV